MTTEKMSVQAKGLDREKVLKASFVLKCKGSNLSQAVSEMVNKLALEYEKK